MLDPEMSYLQQERDLAVRAAWTCCCARCGWWRCAVYTWVASPPVATQPAGAPSEGRVPGAGGGAPCLGAWCRRGLARLASAWSLGWPRAAFAPLSSRVPDCLCSVSLGATQAPSRESACLPARSYQSLQGRAGGRLSSEAGGKPREEPPSPQGRLPPLGAAAWKTPAYSPGFLCVTPSPPFLQGREENASSC